MTASSVGGLAETTNRCPLFIPTDRLSELRIWGVFLELHDNEENLAGVSFSLDASTLLAIPITKFCALLQRLISVGIQYDRPALDTSVMPANNPHPSFKLQLIKSKRIGTKHPERKLWAQTNYMPTNCKTSGKLDIQNLFSQTQRALQLQNKFTHIVSHGLQGAPEYTPSKFYLLRIILE